MSTNLFVTQAANSLSTSLIFHLAVVFSHFSYRFPLSLQSGHQQLGALTGASRVVSSIASCCPS